MTSPRKGTRTRTRRLVLAAAALTTLVLAGCSEAENNKQNALDPHGADAEKINNLFTPVAIIAILVGIFIIIATIFVALKFRYREGKNENPKQVHGNSRLEIGWTIIPALLLAVIAVPTVATIFDLADAPAADALEVTVIGKQWWWEFQYPSAKVITANELHIPVGRDVAVKLKACDQDQCNVIHSFWVPELSGTRDVVPGRTTTIVISADEPGTYLGQCKEYCGLSHANMRFRVIAQTPDDFADWLSGQQQGPVNELSDADGKVVDEPAPQLINKFQCVNCHVFDNASTPTYGPNLTHLASRTTFASGYYELNKSNLVSWLQNAPGMIPMESQGCRESPQGICVGMPSFTENTPKGLPEMTPAEASTIADWLLEQK
ncbi:MAG TPA: cytochrome c oxidase subunit II [Acidimicrobiia bacterium]|nr:cytochrome c oxidase subunit II [Acidimicrobiia bacterium]